MPPRVRPDPRHPGAVWEFARQDPATWHLPPHAHEELEANLLTRGRLTYLIDGRRVDLGPGTLLWLHPDEHHGLAGWSPDCRFDIVVFAPALLRAELPAGHARRRARGATALRIPALAAQGLAALAARLRALDPARDGAALRAGLAWWLHEAVAAGGAGAAAPMHSLPPPVAAAVAIWEDDPACPLALCARRVGLSPGRLGKAFVAAVGQGVVDFRNGVRLARFRAALARRPGAGLLPAALDAGFGSYAQFHRVFRAVHGCTPAQWQAAAGQPSV